VVLPEDIVGKSSKYSSGLAIILRFLPDRTLSFQRQYDH
jgi:hypothetical protein